MLGGIILFTIIILHTTFICLCSKSSILSTWQTTSCCYHIYVYTTCWLILFISIRFLSHSSTRKLSMLCVVLPSPCYVNNFLVRQVRLRMTRPKLFSQFHGSVKISVWISPGLVQHSKHYSMLALSQHIKLHFIWAADWPRMLVLSANTSLGKQSWKGDLQIKHDFKLSTRTDWWKQITLKYPLHSKWSMVHSHGKHNSGNSFRFLWWRNC